MLTRNDTWIHRGRPGAWAVLVALCLIVAAGCSSSPGQPEEIDGVAVYDPQDPEVASGPEFKQSKFKVYWIFRPQIQRRDFNGVFDIFPDRARIVTKFWNQKFVELTREDYYDEFFMTFYEYMASFAQTYPTDTAAKERTLDRLEKHFQLFCSTKKIEPEFIEFQQRQAAILEN